MSQQSTLQAYDHVRSMHDVVVYVITFFFVLLFPSFVSIFLCGTTCLGDVPVYRLPVARERRKHITDVKKHSKRNVFSTLPCFCSTLTIRFCSNKHSACTFSFCPCRFVSRARSTTWLSGIPVASFASPRIPKALYPRTTKPRMKKKKCLGFLFLPCHLLCLFFRVTPYEAKLEKTTTNTPACMLTCPPPSHRAHSTTWLSGLLVPHSAPPRAPKTRTESEMTARKGRRCLAT